MFSHDPFQTYQTLGAYGAGIPYGLPYQGIQPNIHQLGFTGQPYGQQGIGGFTQSPLQQLLGLNPLLQNPLLQNPLLQNPLAHAGWQTPGIHPLLAYQQMLAQQMWQTPQTQFGYPLAPQSLTGGFQGGFQGGINPQQPYGQINPLAQLARQFGYF